jgi:hypothetical protein
MNFHVSSYRFPTWDQLVLADVLAFVNECRRALYLPEASNLCRGRRACDGHVHASVIGRSIVENDKRPLESEIDTEACTITVRDLSHHFRGQSYEHVFEIPSNIVWLFLRPFENTKWEFEGLRQEYRDCSIYDNRYRLSCNGISRYVQYADEVREILMREDVNWISEGYANRREAAEGTHVWRSGDRAVSPTRFVGAVRAAEVPRYAA